MTTVTVSTTPEGVVYTRSDLGTSWADEAVLDARGTSVHAFGSQLQDLGFAERRDDGAIRLPWSRLHGVLAEEDLCPTQLELPVPPVDPSVVPVLVSRKTVVDDDFSISIRGWRRNGVLREDRLEFVGPVHHDDGTWGPFTLGDAAFRLREAVVALQRLPAADRTHRVQRLALAEIREFADRCGAGLDNYLRTTIVLRPKMVGLDIERTHVEDDLSVEVVPTFAGAPTAWLRKFDRLRGARDVYSVTGDHGDLVDIVVDDRVKEVLTEIKQLPGRRVAGPRARALLENPVAFFGDEAAQVLDQDRIERSLSSFREALWTFRPHVVVDDERISHVEVVLEPLGASVDAATEIRRIETPDGLRALVRILSTATTAGYPAFVWAGRDIEVGTAADHLVASLARTAAAWADEVPVSTSGEAGAEDLEPRSEAPADVPAPVRRFLIDADLVLDISRYYDRVTGVGIETPYAIITVPLNAKGAWVPEAAELALLLSLPPGPDGTTVELELSAEQMQTFVAAVDDAEAAGRAVVPLPTGGTMPTAEARAIVAALPPAAAIEESSPDPAPDVLPPAVPQPRTGLLLQPNIDEEDFVAEGNELLSVPDGATAILPVALRRGVELKAHQLAGLRRLQHLFSESPTACRGVLLADDMGLGKTLQLLSFIAREREHDPDLAPALVVAPVSLLENWAQEVERFFEPGTLPVTTLYGAGLREHRVAPEHVDQRLRDTGLKRFLRPGWQEGSAIVLTTYETLRDYEFSFADVTWSIVACDEAQKIKNPNALVSRAAKKLRARFCVAATGTPVENNLADLWSLFDFIQPGLLEPLNQFNKLYRKPIEARTDEQKHRLDTLRDTIRPQMIRRVKEDVAKDLPPKLADDSSRNLVMSDHQRVLYANALRHSGVTAGGSPGNTEILNLLAVLRRICTDPRVGPELEAPLPPLDQYRRIAPKMDWLIATLEHIEAIGEKAIVFLDRKDVQRLVRRYVQDHFGFAPEIINGDTPVGGAGADSRQGRIDRFQTADGFGVMILSPVAAGVGLNIQAANHVIHYMRHWNPAKEDQATDRAYRIGQQRPVHVYTPIVRGDGWTSFDQRLDELLSKKRGLARDILNGADDVSVEGFLDLLDVAGPAA